MKVKLLLHRSREAHRTEDALLAGAVSLLGGNLSREGTEVVRETPLALKVGQHQGLEGIVNTPVMSVFSG